jgi:hypothetical protein
LLIICAGLSAVGAFAEGPGCIIEHAATELTAISVSQRIATSLVLAYFLAAQVGAVRAVSKHRLVKQRLVKGYFHKLPGRQLRAETAPNHWNSLPSSQSRMLVDASIFLSRTR